MQPGEMYEQLLGEITDEMERQVLDELLTGRTVTRREFIWVLFGEVVPVDANLANDPRDRKVRKCIEQLREKDFAIVSSSKQTGYRLVVHEVEVEHYLKEQRRRKESIERKIRHGERAMRKLPMLREYQVTRKKVEQLGLFGE